MNGSPDGFVPYLIPVPGIHDRIICIDRGYGHTIVYTVTPSGRPRMFRV